jgi:light-regulated signal transduction histidine kinase (bacteriophytochrome)
MSVKSKIQDPPETSTAAVGVQAACENPASDALRATLREQELRHAEALEQLTYALMHDLSELLRMVRSYVQMQNRSESHNAEADEFATYILDGAQRMEQMLSDLVVYSRLFRPLDKPTQLSDAEAVLEGVLLNLDALIRKTNASVTYDPLPKVSCDSTHLSHLFRHLLVNAMTFRKEEPPRIHVSATDEGGEAVFSVRDNGIGIDPRFHEQIFAIFKRLHGRDYPGNGMGLAICKRIVEQNSGRIWVESTPNQGSIFQFTLPR